ncbi:MAG: sodium:proton antiporter [Chitinophagaceae bacterium]|nr:MAG: sodium:proton antiporter [Chitinophagaceae bacterium]
MSGYILVITIIGIASLGMAWFPSISKKLRISYSVFYVLFGMVLYSIFIDYLPAANPFLFPEISIHLTELVVIISLMGSGLKIDQPFSFRTWQTPFRLVSVTMILCIALVALLAVWLLNFSVASAVLLGAVLAPTDPVLASDVQVEPPNEGRKENVKFSLTAEAGMNDGMAFPFTWLAIILASKGINSYAELGHWFLIDVLYKLAAGVLAGILLGRLLAYLVFDLPERKNFVVIKDGFVAVATTLMVYGLTEMIHGYGFIAVFVTAITLRNYEINHKYHKKLHDFTDQIERILVSIVLIVFGGTIIHGILQPLNWKMVILGIAFIVFIRPASAWVGMVGTKLKPKEKTVIAFFGIRGIGSFFYLAFAMYETDFGPERELWAVVSFIVLLSLLIHGLTATKTIRKLEKEAEKESTVKQESSGG